MPPGGKLPEDPPPAYSELPPGGVADYGAFGSSETVKSELSIFDGPSYQVTQIRSNLLEIAPMNQYQGTSKCDIKFKLVGSPGWYMDFSDSFITLQLKIKKADGKADVEKDVVAFENFPIVTMFKDVSLVTSNQTKIEGENQTYAYRGYLYTLLNASYTAKKFQLRAAGWIKDDYGQLDEAYVADTIAAKLVTAKGSGNAGFGVRREWTVDGGTLEVVGGIFLDTWLQPQYMLDGQDFFLKFQLNDPAFALHSMKADTTAYKIDVLDCKLYLKHVQVAPDVILGHAAGLQSRNMIITYNGHKLYGKLIKAGGLVDYSHDIFSGVYPKACIIGLVDHDAYCGKYHMSPYNFQPFGVTEVGLTVNGSHLFGSPLNPDFSKKLVARSYYQMFTALGKNGVFGDDNGITMEDWAKGCTLYCFNFAPDGALSGHAQPARLSNICLTLKFDKAIDKPLQLLALAIYDTHVEMNSKRLWFLDQNQSAN